MNNIIDREINEICRESIPWEQLRGKSVLITGASGFLGTWIVRVLLQRNMKYGDNITINALCRNRKKVQAVFGNIVNMGGLNFIYQDVCEEIDDKFRSDIIIHAASPANPYVIEREPYKVIEANVHGYDHILKKAEKWHTYEVLHFSSSAVYGYESPQTGADESFRDKIDFTNRKDVYCLSKQMCEMMSECYTKKNLLVNTVRPFVVYGPGDNLDNKKAWIDFMKNCLRNENIIIKSNGSAVRSYIYVADAIMAIFYVLLKGKGEAYNIASSVNNINIRELAGEFAKMNQNISVEFQYDSAEYLNNNTMYMTGNSDKILGLGWKEKVSLNNGIERTLNWGKEMLNKNAI